MPQEFIDDIDDEQLEAAPPEEKDPKGGKEEMVTIPKAELDSIRRERDESRQSEKYWAGIAQNGRGNERQAAPPADEQLDASQFVDDDAPNGLDDDTPEKLVDDLAAKGVQGLKARGFITAADAQRLAVDVAAKVAREIVGREQQKATSDNAIRREYPELWDQSSDLFKATQKIYQEAVAMDPNAAKTPAALFLAAKAAKASLAKPAPRRGEDDDYGEERESDRRQRASSQDGRARGRGQAQEADDMLGSEARAVIKSMGITDDEFRAMKKDTPRGYSQRGRR